MINKLGLICRQVMKNFCRSDKKKLSWRNYKQYMQKLWTSLESIMKKLCRKYQRLEIKARLWLSDGDWKVVIVIV